MTSTVVVASGVHCPHCGQAVPISIEQANDEARRRIQELESQVKFLTARVAQTGKRDSYFFCHTGKAGRLVDNV